MKGTSKLFYRFLLLVSVIAVTMFPAACTAPAPPPAVATPPSTQLVVPPLTTTPLTAGQVYETIHIQSPLPFLLVPTGDITITLKVTNFKLVDKIGQALVLGEGHIIYYQDVDTPIDRSKPAIPTFGLYAASTSPTYTWKNVPIGTRQFSAQLVNNDNTPLGTPTYDAITLTVVSPSSGPGLTGSIGAGSGDAGALTSFFYNSGTKDATVAVTARNFKISPDIGLANQVGQGHYIYYMDVEAPTASGKAVTTAAGSFAASTADYYIWKNVQPGPHTFSVQLVNNDNTPLTPPIVYKIVVNAQAVTTP